MKGTIQVQYWADSKEVHVFLQSKIKGELTHTILFSNDKIKAKKIIKLLRLKTNGRVKGYDFTIFK